MTAPICVYAENQRKGRSIPHTFRAYVLCKPQGYGSILALNLKTNPHTGMVCGFVWAGFQDCLVFTVLRTAPTSQWNLPRAKRQSTGLSFAPAAAGAALSIPTTLFPQQKPPGRVAFVVEQGTGIDLHLHPGMGANYGVGRRYAAKQQSPGLLHLERFDSLFILPQ